MNIRVQKYGGTSVGDVDKIKKIRDMIIQKVQQGEKLLIVLSAMGTTTNQLIELAKGVSEKPSPRELDMLLTTGEQASISLLTMALVDQGCRGISYTGHQLGIETTSFHQNAKIKKINSEKILQVFKKYDVIVAAGFQGINRNQEYTTLGRGGSDTSAVALAAVLDAPCEIYTDVDGIFSGDPRKLNGAKKISRISYDEMMEMASLGAGVIHPRAVELASKYKTPIYIASTFSEEEGTWITKREEVMEEAVVTGITSSLEDVQITIKNLNPAVENLSSLFSRLGEGEVNIDMISQMVISEVLMNVSFTIPKTALETAKEIMYSWLNGNENSKVEYNDGIAKISVIGLGMRSHSGVAARVFKTMAVNRIPIKMVTTSEISITWIVDEEHENRAVDLVGKEFQLSNDFS